MDREPEVYGCRDERYGVKTRVVTLWYQDKRYGVRTSVAVSRLALSSVVVSRQTLWCQEKRRGVNVSVVVSGQALWCQELLSEDKR